MAFSAEDAGRRIRAKRYNEQIKLVALTLNTIGLTLFGSAIIIPLVAGALNVFGAVWIIFAAALHCSAHVALRNLRGED